MRTRKSLVAVKSLVAKVGIEIIVDLDYEVILFDSEGLLPEQAASDDDPEGLDNLYNAAMAAYSERIEAVQAARARASNRIDSLGTLPHWAERVERDGD